MYPLRLVFITSGWISLGLGFAGIFLPVLPTTPFVLLSAYCFSKGSPRLHNWLLQQPRFGKLIRDWEEHRAIERKAKITATACIILLFSITLLFTSLPLPLKGTLVAIGAGVLVFIWTRATVPASI